MLDVIVPHVMHPLIIPISRDYLQPPDIITGCLRLQQPPIFSRFHSPQDFPKSGTIWSVLCPEWPLALEALASKTEIKTTCPAYTYLNIHSDLAYLILILYTCSTNFSYLALYFLGIHYLLSCFHQICKPRLTNWSALWVTWVRRVGG